MSRVFDPRARLAAVTATLAMAVNVGCGARTALPTGEPCDKPGLMQRCSNPCGHGERTCKDGFWGICMVPETRRACSNACGEGEQVCIEGAWQTCSVPLA